MRVFYRWYHPRCDGSLLVMVVYCVTWVGLTKVLSTVVVMGWFRNMTLSHIFHNYISVIFIYFSYLFFSPVLLGLSDGHRGGDHLGVDDGGEGGGGGEAGSGPQEL